MFLFAICMRALESLRLYASEWTSRALGGMERTSSGRLAVPG